MVACLGTRKANFRGIPREQRKSASVSANGGRRGGTERECGGGHLRTDAAAEDDDRNA